MPALGFHGVFIETQGSEPFKQSKGGRVRVLAEGNYIGFRDCGSDGLRGTVTSRNSVYAEILHDKTILNDVHGINGELTVDLADGVKGIVFGNATNTGPYVYHGEIRKMIGDAVTTKAGAVLPPRLLLDLRVSGCGGGAIVLDKPSVNLTLDVQEWSNGGPGLALTGTGTARDLALRGCDFRSGGVTITQALAGDIAVSTDTRGVSVSKVTRLVVTGTDADIAGLTWTPSLSGTVTDYSVQYKLPEAAVWTSWAHPASTSAEAAIQLKRGHTYDFRVAAVTAAGIGEYTPTVRGIAGAPSATDGFNRPAASLAGVPLSGSSGSSWALATAEGGVMSTYANSVARVSAGGAVYATVPSPKRTGAVQTKLHAVTSKTDKRRQALVIAFAGISTYFRLDTRPTSTEYKLGLRKSVAGAVSILSLYSRQAVDGDILRAEWDLDTKRIAWYVNEEFVAAVVDEDLTYSTAAGLYGDFSADPVSSFDDFKAWV